MTHTGWAKITCTNNMMKFGATSDKKRYNQTPLHPLVTCNSYLVADRSKTTYMAPLTVSN